MNASLFEVHILNDDGKVKAVRIANAFTNLLAVVAPLCKDGREYSLFKTKLEEACFYAKKSMAMDDSNHQ